MKHEDLERIVRSVGMDAGLMSMGAASCIYSEGCEGVTMTDFQRLADAIEAHALAQRPESAGEGAEGDEAVRKPLTAQQVMLGCAAWEEKFSLGLADELCIEAFWSAADIITYTTKGDAR